MAAGMRYKNIISNLKNPWIRLRIPEGKIKPKAQIIGYHIGKSLADETP
ncbi:hypothetical protein [Anaerostipes sp. PC18]|nr:hypothetical protein P8F77_01925 [Anaerostipes sp. PC18]